MYAIGNHPAPIQHCCGRCRREIPYDEEKVCWYCRCALCYECWLAFGHCGHPKANEINEREHEAR
jgi:hypothetical protein